MAYQLRLLGRFRLMSPDGDEIAVTSKKGQVLLALLALAGGKPVSRDDIIALLWSDRGEAQARSSLRQAFTSLRKTLGGNGDFPLKIDEEQAAIDLDVLAVDIQSILSSDASDGSDPWDGIFLEGLGIHDGAIEDWLLGQRQRFQTILIDRLSTQSSDLEAGESYDEALAAAQRLLRADPLHEPAHRTIMRCHAKTGDRIKALKQYQACLEILEAELAIAPDNETRALYNSIRDGETARQTEALPVRPETAPDAAPPPISGIPILAVLPFDDLSGGAGERHFAEGITRELITELGRFSTLKLVAAATMFAIKDKHIGARDIGIELGATYLLEGSIQIAGDRARVTAQLTAADNGTQIWADRFDLDATDRFATQDLITRRIASNLYQPFLADRFRRAAAASPAGADAFDLYMAAMQQIEKPSRAGVRRARDYCRKALEADPTLSLVYEVAMWTYLHEAWNGWCDDPQAALAQAHDEAAKGITLDDREPYLIGSLGFIDVIVGNREAGLARMRGAIELTPNDFVYSCLLGGALSFAGKPEEALEFLAETERLNPGYHVTHLFQGDAHFLLGNLEKAIADYEAFLAVLPEFNWALVHLAACQVELGQIEEARKIVARIRGLSEEMTQDYLRRFLQHRDPAVVERLLAALDRAGLPNRGTPATVGNSPAR